MTTSHYDDMEVPVLVTVAEWARQAHTLPTTLRAKMERDGVRPVAKLRAGGRTHDLFPIPPGTLDPRHLVPATTP